MSAIPEQDALRSNWEKPKGCYECVHRRAAGVLACRGCPFVSGHMIGGNRWKDEEDER